jgi:hypothetical protein
MNTLATTNLLVFDWGKMIQSVPNQPLVIRQRVPIIGQQQPTQQQQEQMARMQIMQAINEMASGMYVKLATDHIASRDPDLYDCVDVILMRATAKKCMTAAKAFFEGIGVIQTATNSEIEPDGSDTV